MSNHSLLQKSQPYTPATMLAPLVAGWGGQALRVVTGGGLLAGLAGILYTSAPVYFASGHLISSAPAIRLYAGLALWSLVGYTSLYLGRYFFQSYYFSGLDTVLSGERATSGVVYEVAAIVLSAPQDVTAGFIHSPFGTQVLARVGVTESEVQEEFLATARTPIVTSAAPLPETQVTLVRLLQLILDQDHEFVSWLQGKGVHVEHMQGAAVWTYREHIEKKRRQRWWSKDQLRKRTGIGRDFIYGVAYTLDMYSKPLSLATVYHDRATKSILHPELVERVEQQLVQADSGNVLLVGEAGVGKLDIVAIVAERLASGEALGAVLAPQVRLLDTERLLTAAGDKVVFERTFMKLLYEAAAAGNTVMVIDDLPAFIAGAARYGVAVDTLLDEYLTKTTLRVIATSTPAAYHEFLETNGQLLRGFQVETVTTPDVRATQRILETLATTYFTTHGIRCTYQALAQIATAADRYVVNGVMPDKAIHLFDEVMIASGRDEVITVADVDRYVSDSTGIPIGPLDHSERSLLLRLEEVLHERIVGQDAAVRAISSVMRRARADIQASDKPLGSFLFMGPTGVGKTETAKALAAIFFDREENMHRFDMSEYSGNDAVASLIGTATSTGSLPAALREQPYAVVLLDEFEKATVAVHDVFLQILDEGQFTDGRGQRINARNTIIVATSNAGSEKLLEWLDTDRDLEAQKQELIEYVMAAGVYKPELVNRFDEVVLFAPLTESEQRQIAKQLLEELAVRTKQKGYTLSVTDELVTAVAARGYDTEFGARSMRRAIQTLVEDAIAKRVIAGTLQSGDTITFTPEELSILSAS